jgi:high-affinity nickel-transport protein
MFATVLPEWIDPLMEKAVGITLLVLGGWIFYSLTQHAAHGEGFVLQSRCLFILAKIQRASAWIYCRLTGRAKLKEVTVRQYNAPAAFGIGMIHGFGAETGTQVLLIAAVGGSSTHVLGVMILLSFISGLLISNTIVALVTCAGFVNSAKFKSLFVTTSVVTGIFSLVVGTIFVCGYAGILPDLQH